MSLQPIWPIWLTALLAGSMLALVGWQAWRTSGANRVGWFRRGGMVVLLLAIGLGPSVEDRVSDALISNAEVYFVVDRTGSMAAEDFGPDGATRLFGVQADIEQLTRLIPASQYSIIAFDSQSSKQMPLTSDARAVRAWAQTLRQEVTAYSGGSTIDRPLFTLEMTLGLSQEANPENVRLVYFFADGENTRGSNSDPDAIESYGVISHLVDGGAVLGYGTPEGGQMRRYTGIDEPQEDDWIIDSSTTEPAISKLDETQLRTVAGDLEVPYQHRFDDSSMIKLVDGIELAEVAADGRRDALVYKGLFWIGALVLGGLLAWEAWDLLRQVPGRRGTKRGEQDPMLIAQSKVADGPAADPGPTGAFDLDAISAQGGSTQAAGASYAAAVAPVAATTSPMLDPFTDPSTDPSTGEAGTDPSAASAPPAAGPGEKP